MKKIFSRLFSLLLVVCMVVTLLPTYQAHAEEKSEEPKVDITVNDVLYENVTSQTECIIGNVDINEVEVKIISVNGYKLENVGTKSGVLDSQGRTVLEYNCIEQGNGVWMVRLCYHDVDDPVESNHGYGFEIVGITFKSSVDSQISDPEVDNVENAKLTSKSKALKVTWKKADCSGYQMKYSTSEEKLSSAKTIKISKSKTSYTIKNLKGSKKYYVKIRTYKKYTDALGNEKTIYGKWVTLSAKTKK